MEELIKLSEKLKGDDKLEKEDLESLKLQQVIEKNKEIVSLINLLQNPRTINFVGNESVLNILLKEKNISISDDASITVRLSNDSSDIECDEQDLVIVDGLEKFIKSSQNLESLDKYRSKFLENYRCKNIVAISFELVKVLQDNDIDEWEEIFDNLGSDNPQRDIKEYSNGRELLNRLSLELMNKEKLNYNKLQKLLDSIIKANSSLEYIDEIRAKYRSENNYKKIYQQKRQKLITIARDLSVKLQNEPIKETMKEVANKLETQEFSIGITGIIKAGKSTMLNALLKKDILGTAIRPETANLTVIKKAKQPKAIVHFWSEDEWKTIKHNALDEQAKEFVQASEELDKFSSCISEKAKFLEINVEKLDNYTSARKSDGLCNLVKEVELQLDLEFLDEGVVIVDTPGIDDPIVQREIITLEYLKSCSAILHLMNAKQSATQKDIEFIGDALIDQGISSLLIVITRIDTLGDSKKEIDEKLAEIILHAKTNLESYLSRRTNDDISDILCKLEFLPLAGKFALEHRIGESEKALKKGYELKDTGILEIENYINSMLFGDKNERAKLAISNATRTIVNTANIYNDNLQENYDLIGLEKEEIDKKLDLVTLEREEVAKQLDEIFKEIESEESKIRRFLKNSKNSFELEFNDFRKKLIDNISSYIINNLYEEIKQYIETELKEFISEITRFYQREAQNKLEDSIDYIDTQYDKLTLPDSVKIDLKIDKVDVLNDFAYLAIMIGFGGAVGFAFGFLFGPLGILGTLLINWWAGDMIDEWRREKIKTKVDEKILTVDRKLEEMNNNIYQNMIQELKKYDDEIISYFKQVAMKPANELQQIMQEKEATLKELRENLISKEKSDNELKENLSTQIEVIKQNLNNLKEI